ncbi:MAG: GNAT family N-acetyltransferase [Cytophagales bacterium]|nr:GNAT family N-acetyltransferase [Cytophagales bacterium]
MINGRNIRIRATEDSDNEFLTELLNDLEIAYYEGRNDFPYSNFSQHEWFSKNHKDGQKERMIIEDKNNQTRYGYITFKRIDEVSRRAHIAIKLGKASRGKGIAVDAVKSLMSFLFFIQNYNRLEGHIAEYNIPSQKLFIDKCNWEVEGKAKDALFMHNEFHSLLWVSCLRKDYLTKEVDTFYLDPKNLY